MNVLHDGTPSLYRAFYIRRIRSRRAKPPGCAPWGEEGFHHEMTVATALTAGVWAAIYVLFPFNRLPFFQRLRVLAWSVWQLAPSDSFLQGLWRVWGWGAHKQFA